MASFDSNGFIKEDTQLLETPYLDSLVIGDIFSI